MVFAGRADEVAESIAGIAAYLPIAVMNARRILWKTMSDKFGLRFGALNQNRNSSNKAHGTPLPERNFD